MIIENNKVKNIYNGARFHVEESETIDEWGYKIITKDFMMTRPYVKSCRQTQQAQELYDVRVARNKLKYQLNTFGDVDQLDLMYYKTLCKRVGYSNLEFDKKLAMKGRMRG